MTIPCPDGSALLRAREGGLMGDSNEPETFMGNYHEAIDDYRMDTHNRIAKPMIVTNEWTNTTVDASMGSYLDDPSDDRGRRRRRTNTPMAMRPRRDMP